MLNQSRNQLVFGVMMVLLAPCWLIAPVYAEILFGAPTRVPVEGVASVDYPQVSHDGLELYFASPEPGRCSDIWVMRRPSADADWDAPIRLDSPVNSLASETAPCISPDGLELYFSDEDVGTANGQQRPGGYGKADMWVSRRSSKDDPWGEPENLGPMINTAEDEDAPSLSADGLSLHFMSSRYDGYGAYDLYVSTRASKDDPWGPAQNVGAPVNTTLAETTPILSPDGLSLFFSAGIPAFPAAFKSDAYVSRRASLCDPWDAPVPFEAVQIPGVEFSIGFCEADSTLYFSNSATVLDLAALWKVEVMLDADFNADGVVDALDVCVLAENWGKISARGGNDPRCDIAPYPITDGVVDALDLRTLADCMLDQEQLDEQ